MTNSNTTKAALPNNVIYCPRSGVPLAKVEALCSHGWPVINQLASVTTGLLHPVYAMPLDKLIIKLKNELAAAEQIAWCSIDADQRELQLTMSAIMYSIDAVWQPAVEATHLWNKLVPALPMWPVVVASGGRLLRLASWYHYATSKRLRFPLYRISHDNKNTHWENFSTWLDDSYEIKEEWEKGRDNLQHAEEVKARTDALLTVRADAVYKRIDLNKVWNWIDIQMRLNAKYPVGRRETFKTIFMTADMHPEDWNTDDVEDVQMAILETCDIGNEIMFFIRTRLNNIHAIIRDFYSSFTLIRSVAKEGSATLDSVSQLEQDRTTEFFGGFDKRAESLDAMPPEPQREHFATPAKYLQAAAQWRILKKRYDHVKQAAATPVATAVKQAADPLEGL